MNLIQLIFTFNFCLHPGDAYFYDLQPFITQKGFRKELLRVRLNNYYIPILENGSVLVGVDLFHNSPHLVLTLEENEKSEDLKIQVCEKEYPVEEFSVPPSFVFFSEKELKRIKREKELLDKIWVRCTEKAWDIPFQNPLPGYDPVDNFGTRRILNDQPRSPHTGVDIPAPSGTPVLSAGNGRVVLTKDLFFGGKSIIIDHGGCLYTMYFHLSKFAVKEGAFVKKGEVIGYVGSTGRATSPHLHFGVRYADMRINPLYLLSGKVINYSE